MRINIGTKISPIIRILSFFLALIILSITFENGFVNISTSVNAANSDYDGLVIHSDTKETTDTIKNNLNLKASANSSIFTYTGKMTRADVELFDYVSDYEINNSYNQITHTEGGYDDAYTKLNSKISNSSSSLSQNIKIVFKPTNSSYETENVHVYFFGGTATTHSWPGTKMNYDKGNKCFYYIAKYTDLNSPTGVIINDGNDPAKWKTEDLTCPTAGHTLTVTQTLADKIFIRYVPESGYNNSLNAYFWKLDSNNKVEWNNGWAGASMTRENSTGHYTFELTNWVNKPNRLIINNKDLGYLGDWQTKDIVLEDMRSGLTYFIENDGWDGNRKVKLAKLISVSTDTSNLYDCIYTNPLYFGCFWLDNDASGYTTSNKPASLYDNFYWRANMGLKPYNTRGNASVQDLVYGTLSGGNASGTLLDVNGTTQLPYFSKSWVNTDSNSTYIKYFDNDDTGDAIHFPFYEVTTEANSDIFGNGDNKIEGDYHASTEGSPETQYARFYQFSSKEANLRFQIDDVSKNKGHFVETTYEIKHGSNTGYFPFNSSERNAENQHNLGFGTRFEMPFKLQPDGQVGVINSAGEDLDKEKYPTRVDTIFEFTGDDDLWVFIDGKLVLDMGGAHLESTGKINFTDKTATAKQAISLSKHRDGYTGEDKDDLGVDYEVKSISTTDFRNALKAGSFTDDSGNPVASNTDANATKYDPTVTHVITIFYMERGMLDSNLLIRFNYSPEGNFSKMKIAEVTDVDNINAGLQSLTLQAAEDDVFRYTVKNNNTNGDDPKTNSAVFPKGVKSIRSNVTDNNLKTKLTPTATAGTFSKNFAPSGSWDDPNNHQIWTSNGEQEVNNTSYLWVDEFADNPKNTGLTDSSGNFSLMFGTCKDLYPPQGTPKVGKESSAEFEKQFSRNSTMRVLQSDDLYTPKRENNGTALNPGVFGDNANTTGNQLTKSNTRTVSGYYNTSVEVKDRNKKVVTRNDDSTSADYGTFNFNNNSNADPSLSVMLTEYFTNTPRVGSMTITKQIKDPQNVSEENTSTDFNFKLQLTNVFGVTGVNVTNESGKDYHGIAVKKNSIDGLNYSYADSSLTNSSETSGGTTNYYGTFTLKAGEMLTIDDIPIGTHYKIIEESSDNYEESTGNGGTSNNDSNIIEGELDGTTHKAQTNSSDNANNVTVVNTHITGELKLKKTVSGNPAPSGVNFTFRVTLTPHDGVNLNNYPVGTNYTLNPGTGADAGKYYFDVPNMPYDGTTTVTIIGIPNGTNYEVSEPDVPNSNWTQNPSGSSNLSGIITGSNSTAIIDNTYTAPVTPTITLTKVDSTTNTTITSAEATFYLLKLKDTPPDWTQEATLNGFNSVVAGYSDVPTTDVIYVQTVGGPYNTSSGVLTLTEISSGTLFNAGEKYFFYEYSAPTGYKKNNTVTAGRIITLQAGDNAVNFQNEPEPTEVTVEKTDKTGNGLPGGEFDLYIHETSRIYPPTYSFNTPQNYPNSKDSITISTKSYTIPDNDTTSEITTTTYYTYNYQDETPPSVTEKTWIQPRTDNDYIYFRDFNTGDIGTNDTQAFKNSQDTPYGVETIDDKRYWLNTNLKYNEQGQKQEIDYTHNYWFAAQFTSSSDSTKFKQYAMWERFVDAYSFSSKTINTVVWKIQPPDGYDQVRFCLYDGDICIRTTAKETFVLGKVYTRTGKGTGKTEHGKQCYFDAPINDVQNLSTYYNFANSQTGQLDKRPASTGSMYQADRYEPTEDKIVFHCNSDKVWHNIHIEFFDQSGNPIGQRSPGYMMEPYARAGSDYRINGYLTYELTIPKDAKKFRVNNGVDTTVISSYNYHSSITDLLTTNGKNSGNYFKIAGGNPATVTSGSELTMEYWSNNRDTSETYSPNNEIESDYDYIYFEKPADWSDHVYAYFYGGGDLQADNWQRACYSVWPGVAPVGSDYDPSGTDYHSDVYTYTYNNDILYSAAVNTAGNTGNAPDAVYTDKDSKKVYKFRIPMGDRTNYGKVIFNDGLSIAGGSHQTKVIAYSPGNVYYGTNGKSYNHFASSSTNIYTSRNNNDDEYIYVKVPTASQSTWDDLHIVFYDSAEKRILQKSPGYVMKYAGTADGYQYYRVPIPANAAKFSVNNGKQYGSNDNEKKKSTNNTVSTGKYDILPYAASDNVTSEGVLESTQNRLVYELTTSGSTASLNMTSPSVAEDQGSTSRSETINQKYLVDYTKRGDKIYIRDTADWGIEAATNTTGGIVNFYDSNDNIIGSQNTYKLIKTVNETPEQATANDGTEEKAWYWLDIPQGATKFSLTSGGTHSATNVPIYTLNSSADTGSSANWTKENMYYETTGSGLAVLKPTFTDSNPYAAYDNTGSRGDDLYIICEAVGNTTPPKRAVQFYDKDGQPLKNVNATYINDKDGKAWYKAAIPTGATTFTVTTTVGSTNTTTPSAKIYELREKASRYRNDYTLGDMQYDLSSGNDVLTCTYPVYTEEALHSLDGHPEITTESGLSGVDESAVSEYINKDVESVLSPSANVPTPQPVLYPTPVNQSASYEWQEGADDPDYYYVRFKNTLGWSSVRADYINSVGGAVTAGTPVVEGTGTNAVYKFKNTGNCDKVYFYNASDTSKRTVTISLAPGDSSTSGSKYGYGYLFAPSPFNDPGSTSHTTDANGYYLVQIQEPTPTSTNQVSVTEWNQTTTGGYTDYIWFYCGTDGTYSMTALYFNASGSQSMRQSTAKNVQIGNTTHYFYKFPYDSNYTYIMFFDIHSSHMRIYQPQTLSTSMKGQIYSEDSWTYDVSDNHPHTSALDVLNSQITIDGTFNGKTIGVFTLKDVTSDYANSTYMNMGTPTYSVKTITYPTTPVTPSTTQADYSAKYQPEDRYALISDNSAADANDFITINTTMNNPYIMFRDSSNNSVFAQVNASKPVATTGMKLEAADKDGTSGSPYKIRLPKNATSFIVSSGPDTLGSNVIQLYESGFHHAGSTFTINDNGTLASTTRRSYTTDKTDIVYPINPKTDKDYIFFKDDGTFVNDGKVYAYYYGDIDGEYKAWPGVPAQRSYVDNDGKTVYVFQPPKSANGNGTYSKVIFNNGNPTSRVITTAQNITFGNIYTPTSSTEHYGEQTTAAKQVGTTSKSTPSTSDYSSASYIFFRNNGTYTFSTGVGTGNRYVLDDVHIEFFADESGTTPVGSTGYGYIPDKLSGENIYRITIPNGAKYFRINNGEKSSGSTNYNSRQSEIKQITPNGLYKFVESTTPAEVWDNNAAASSAAELDDHFYYLDLENKIVIDEEDIDPDIDIKDIKLATVVTGSDGKQAYIKWLKSKPGSPTEVDTEYLDHVMTDIGPTGGSSNNGVKTVKIVKKATGTTDEDTYYYWVETVAPTGYILPDDGTQKQNVTSGTGTITNKFEDEPVPLEGGKVTLIKLSKEQVGKNPTGTALAGAQFKLIKIKADGTDDSEVIKFAEDTAGTDGAYTTSSSGTFNDSSNWLVTGSDGKLVLNKVPIGSYCLEEQTAPSGYSNLDSNNLDTSTTPATPKKKRVYFSIGKTGPDSIVDKEITMSDEMAPAYIKLYEHINEKRDVWGDPTFIFRIKQTGYYNNGTLVTNDNDFTPRERLVSLTIDDNGKRSAGLITGHYSDNYDNWFEESTVEKEGEAPDDVLEYQGMFGIDDQGRIRLEPGQYEITRVPSARYEFVENAYKVEGSADDFTSTLTEKLTLTIPAGTTELVHYYDKVGYYDKFSQRDTSVNEFYTLDASKKNTTLKGIRVEDYRQRGTNTDDSTYFDTIDTTLGVDISSRTTFKAYFIYSDGSEKLMTSTEKQSLTIAYNPDDNKVNGTGVTLTDFSYANNTITVAHADTHASERYTLTASYPVPGATNNETFDAKFDLVFKVAES